MVTNLRINVGQNEISYNFPSFGSPRLYWSLPELFTGNKVNYFFFSKPKKLFDLFQLNFWIVQPTRFVIYLILTSFELFNFYL